MNRAWLILTALVLASMVSLAACGGANTNPPAQGQATSLPQSRASASNALLTLRGLTEYAIPTANAYPFDITLGPDGNLWFTEQSNQIGRITPAGRITQFAIPVRAFGITAAPDGNLWFTSNFLNDSVGRITTRGVVSVFPLRPICNCPHAHTNSGITVGPDGELYFGAQAGSISQNDLTWGLEKLTTSGKVTLLYAGRLPIVPLWLTRGPDNAVWFTSLEFRPGYGRVTPSGGFTFYPHSTDNGGPLGITAGRDGALWFTDWLTDISNAGVRDKIARLTTSGNIIAEYTIPTPNSFPAQIVSGPDGNLWFAELGGAFSKIGRITPSGLITEFPLAANSRPYGITNGPAGTIWFTETAGNKIAKFTP